MGENQRCSCRVLMVPRNWVDPLRSHNVCVRVALVLVVLDHGPDCREQLPRPLSRVRVRRDFRRRTKPLEDLLERRPLLFLCEAIVELSDRLLEAVHPEHELLALGQKLRVLLARHGETRPSMRAAGLKGSEASCGRRGSLDRWSRSCGSPVRANCRPAGVVSSSSKAIPSPSSTSTGVSSRSRTGACIAAVPLWKECLTTRSSRGPTMDGGTTCGRGPTSRIRWPAFPRSRCAATAMTSSSAHDRQD